MSGPQEDLAAVERVLAGETAAFTAIVERWQTPLINLAYRFCRDRGRAEDMAQEAFLRAFRGLASWRRDSQFSTWLFALATNLYRTEIRRIPPRSIPIDETLMGAAPAQDPLTEEESRKRVRQAVESLPAKYRDPLLLFYFHERNVASTASSLNLPEGTVKARLSRARSILKTKLGDQP